MEETAALCDHIDATIRSQIPKDELVTILDNIGLPYSGLNLSYSTSAPIGPSDADIQVQLAPHHHPTEQYVERLRTVLARQYPGVTFYALPVDVVTQILNFGLSAPIDIQIVGPHIYANRALAETMLNQVRDVPGAVDARIQQPFNYPDLTVDVDRTRAATRQVKHLYEAQAATYKTTVLAAFNEVEDRLSDLRILEQESAAERLAVADAQHSLDLSNQRYKGGVTSYLEVLTVENTLLQNQRTLTDLETRRYAASVGLVRALGGGWDVSQLPK
ncbi:MAG TPA: TolC family protein [Terracidiphilus sp.]|nr:TolC family protein [Terracidiphilus sp.]